MGRYEQKGGLVKINEKVYVQVGPGSDACHGIIVTKEGIILIDNYVKHHEALTQSIQEIGNGAVKIVINTHEDVDHFSSNHFYRRQGAIIISSEEAKKRISQMMSRDITVQDVKNRNPSLAHELTSPKELVPHIGIQSKATIELGGTIVDVDYVGHGHAPGDLIAYLPEGKILFAGDLVFSGHHGRLKTSDIGGLLNILDKILAMDFDWIVPGHGLPERGTAAHEVVAIYRRYIASLIEKVSSMVKKGLGLDEIKAGFKNWEYIDWERAEPHFQIAIENTYKEVLWRSRF